MPETGWHDRLVTIHRAFEVTTEDRGSRCAGSGYWHEPLCGSEYELVTDGLIDENLRLRGIELWTDVGRVQEMHAHRARRISDRPILGALREIDTCEGREVTVLDRRKRVTVFREGRSCGLKVSRHRRRGRSRRSCLTV